MWDFEIRVRSNTELSEPQLVKLKVELMFDQLISQQIGKFTLHRVIKCIKYRKENSIFTQYEIYFQIL